MSRATPMRSMRAALAILLIPSVFACATQHVTLGSPELNAMNVYAHRTKALVTLGDGAQMKVNKLQVGAQMTRGDAVERRPVPHDDGTAQKASAALAGALIGLHGVKRTYLIEPAAPAPPVPGAAQ